MVIVQLPCENQLKKKFHSKIMKIIESKIDTKEGIIKFKDDCDFA